jgi:hypothetical protein
MSTPEDRQIGQGGTGSSPEPRPAPSAAYSPREVVDELRRAVAEQHGRDATTDDGGELKVEYRAAILLDRQADRIGMLEATLRAIADVGLPAITSREQLAAGALEYPADKVPNAICTEDGDVAWVEVTPITETPEQVLAALKANGMWTVEDDGTVYGYDVQYRTWMVPCVHTTERPLLTHEALANVEYEDDVVYFELNDQRGCETGSWWWRCDESVTEPEAVDV